MKRVAVWLYGGIGTGNFSQGQPVLERLVKELSNEFDITVYTVAVVNAGYTAREFKLVYPSSNVSNLSIRWLILCWYLIRDHFNNKYNSICAFWGFPGGFLATILATLIRRPIVVNLQGGDAVGIPAHDYGVMHRPFFKVLARWSYKKATVLTVLTKFQCDTLAQYGINREVRIIPMGADPMNFKIKSVSAGVNDPIRFVHVSNYNPIKDIDTTIKAFARIALIKNCHLRIVGGEYDGTNIQALIEELGLSNRVEFSGPILYKDMPLHFEWADVLLHTSIYEGQAIVVGEAALCGLLIAGTRVGLLADLGDTAAVLASVGDTETLSDKVLQLLDQPEQLMQTKKASYQWASEHDFSWTVAQYKNMIHELG